MKIFIANISIMAIMLTGCGVFKPRDTDDKETIGKNIYSITKAATEIAIKQIYKDKPDEMLLVAGKISSSVDEYAMPLLTNPDAAIEKGIETSLLNIVPNDLQGVMIAAYEIFYSHYEFPSGEDVLPEPYVTYLRYFLSGVRDGANRVLDQNNAHIDRDHSIHVERSPNE